MTAKGLLRASRSSCLLTLTWLAVAGRDLTAQESHAGACTGLTGAVGHGESFQADLGAGLAFKLVPARHPRNPQGWTIVVQASDPEHDFVAVATPPYRSSNPRYIDTGYGISAQQAVTWTLREFRFVLNEADYQGMHEALAILLWPADYSEGEIATARAAMTETVTGAGTLRIVEARTRPPGPEHPGGLIEYLEFEVELCMPELP